MGHRILETLEKFEFPDQIFNMTASVADTVDLQMQTRLKEMQHLEQ